MFANQFRHVYQFRIVLNGTKVAIWRSLQVSDNYSFNDLHIAIQNVMDWEVYAGSFYRPRRRGLTFAQQPLGNQGIRSQKGHNWTAAKKNKLDD